VNVADLESCIRRLGEILTLSGAKGAAGELVSFAEALKPYAGQKLKDFTDQLEKALGDGTDKKVLAALQNIEALYGRALDADMTPAIVEGEVRKHGNLSKAQLDEVASKFGITRKRKNKEEILKAIIERIVNRKGTHERSKH
jgi:hypothetical protein